MSSEFTSVRFRSLLVETKDGEWGKETSFEDSLQMAVIRGTDFETARSASLVGVPVRFIAKKNGERKTLRPFDILIETAGGSRGRPTGKTVLLRPKIFASSKLPITCASFARYLRIDNSLADPEYLCWYLQHLYSNGVIESHQIQHTGIARFQFTKFADSVDIALPSLVYQAELASFLGALDDRITLLRETNATLEAIAQALFKSWFVDFDPVGARMEGHSPEGMDEATAALFPDGFEESELGLVPRGWRASIMGEVSTVGIGKTPPRKEPQWFSESAGDIRWVSIRDMGVSGVYASKTSEYLTSESIQRFNVRVVPANTTLLSFKMTIGRVAITDGAMTTNEAIAHFKLDPESSLSSEFLYLHLKQFNYASLSSTSSIADAVNSKTVRNIPLLVPNTEVLRAFQNQAKALFSRIKVVEQQAQTLATLRDTLLPRLISGQLRLNQIGYEN